MTIEDNLKEYIIEKYASLREFTTVANMPYSTVYTIFQRGIAKSNVTNLIKVCKVLNISLDELANGRIVPMTHEVEQPILKSTSLEEIFSKTKRQLHDGIITINDRPISDANLQTIDILLDTVIDFARKNC